MSDAFFSSLAKTSFEAQYQRVLEASKCTTQVELADFLGVRQTAISDAIRRKIIPAPWRMKLLEKKHINPDWLLSGTGEKYLVPAGAGQLPPPVTRIVEIRPPQECSAQELINELLRRGLRDLGFAVSAKGLEG